MPLQRQALFWVLALVTFVIFLATFSEILMPFVAGAAIAYLLDPVADRLERIGFSRLLATSVILAIFLTILILMVLLIVPPIARQLVELFTSVKGFLPDTLRQVLGISDEDLAQLSGLLSGQFSLTDVNFADLTAIRTFIENNAGTIAAIAGRVLNQGAALISVVSLLVITPVVTFYLLYDWDRLIARLDDILPLDHKATIRKLIGEIDTVLASFVRGQFTLGIVLGILYAVALTLVGLKFGLVIGLGAGIVSFIPYIGALSGMLASIGVAVVQFWGDPIWILAVAAIFFAGQFIEGNILQPKLVGSAVGLHPVTLLFALMAFGSLFGFTGLLIAVPVAAALGVLARFGLRNYKESALYYGHSGPPASEQLASANDVDNHAADKAS